MKNTKQYDFSGWATRNGIECSDGRTILQDAFVDNDGSTVPLVWNHQHNDATNVLGHALLENRSDGVYAYCTFNETEAGKHAKLLVQHGDVKALSIYANKLKQKGSQVLHGAIREVSLVLAGANPGAFIDFVMAHGEDQEEGFYMFTDEEILLHSDEDEEDEEEENKKDEKESEDTEEPEEKEGSKTEEEDEEMEEEKNMKHSDSEKTVQEVYDSMSEEQKEVCHLLVGMAKEGVDEDNSDDSEGGKEMKHNVFDNETQNDQNVLSHSDIAAIFDDAKRNGSLKFATEQYIAHAWTDPETSDTFDYGIGRIDHLFPDYKAITQKPEFISREMTWVQEVMGAVKHVPFSRIKSLFADITEEDARAKGYIKGNEKVEEVFGLLKRTTDPQTIYKKQKLDRDDIIDIVDFDVVAWLKVEMRMMLDEEIARAILIGDGRSSVSPDKIQEIHIRSVLNDADFYSIKKNVVFAGSDDEGQKAKKVIRAAVKARKDYKGTGTPVLFTTEDWLTDMLLIEDGMGRVIYDTVEKLATALRVKKIVTVEPMETSIRTDESSNKFDTIGIIVNLSDYAVGADKGGAVSLFDDFDIDFNQYKYLIETRCSGALIKPKAAIVLETAHVAG